MQRAYPILNFEPLDLEENDHDLGHGVTLKRCTPETDGEWGTLVQQIEYLAAGNRDNLRDLSRAEWALVFNLPDAPPEAALSKSDIDLREEYARDVTKAALLSLRLVKPCAAQMPLPVPFNDAKRRFKFEGLDGEELVGPQWRPVVEHWPGEFRDLFFGEEDANSLREVFDAVWRVRDMSAWWQDLFGWTEEKVKKDLRRETRGRYKRLLWAPYFFEWAGDILEDLDPNETSRLLLEKTGEPWRRPYEVFDRLHGSEDAIFRQIFQERRDEIQSSQSRLARALALYDGAAALPYLPAFLLMCLVLETLFTTESKDPRRQVVLRGTAVLTQESAGNGKRNRQKMFNEIYSARSDIVHGKKKFGEISDGIRRRAFYLARDCILHIIRDDTHRHWFSKTDTSEEDRQQVKDYVRGLGEARERPDDEPPKL